MRHRFYYSDKSVFVQPYTTKHEKDILIFLTIYKDKDEQFLLNGVFDILGYSVEDIESWTDYEKKMILYKLRSISCSEVINLNFTCKKCAQKQTAEVDVSAENIIVEPKEKDEFVRDKFKELSYDNATEFWIDPFLEDCSIDEFEKIYDIIEKSITKFNFVKDITCVQCRHKNKLDISSTKFLLEYMSDDSLVTLYKNQQNLIFYGKYSKEDVDNMYPYDRVVFTNLLSESLEREKSKQNG